MSLLLIVLLVLLLCGGLAVQPRPAADINTWPNYGGFIGLVVLILLMLAIIG